MRSCAFILLMLATVLAADVSAAGTIDLADATIVTRSGELSSAEQMAATVLVEEIESRTGIHLRTSFDQKRYSPNPAKRRNQDRLTGGGTAAKVANAFHRRPV